MPFLYELKLQADQSSYTFVQQLVPAGTLVCTNQPLATLTDGAMEFHLPAPRQGLLVEWFVEHGDTLENRDILARIVCEGEPVEVPAAIPYRLG
jgi:pyruvate/2-oxoglutarate dehydrogenase complex dihydrolipoamide acyltransferase (E2) component